MLVRMTAALVICLFRAISKEYLEGLDPDLRNCLICNLIGDISANAISDMGLMEV